MNISKKLILKLKAVIIISIFNTALAADTMPSSELGIIVLPSSAVSANSKQMNKAINNDLKIENTYNIPHISLFQGRFPDKNQLQLENTVSEIAQKTLPFNIEMESALQNLSGNIFWMAKLNPELNALHKQILAELPRYTDGLLMQQIMDIPPNRLTTQQALNIKKYGVIWVGENFEPHITIFYKSGSNAQISTILAHVRPSPKMQFIARKIAIARLGYAGNVVQILKEYQLSQKTSSYQP